MASPSDRPTDRAPAPQGRLRFFLRQGDQRLPLPAGSVLVGRSPECDVVLRAPNVSRRHARLVVADDGVVLTDLNSRSGVLVDGRRITGSVSISPGDAIAFGSIVFQLDAEPVGIDSLEDGDRATVLAVDSPPSSLPPVPRTMTAGESGTLSTLIDKSIATNRIDDVLPVVVDRLTRIADASESGREVGADAVSAACQCAVKLVAVTGAGFWINAIVRIYRARSELMPIELIDSLYGVLRNVRGVNWTGFAEYLDALGARADRMTPTERFATRRLEGLLRAGRG
jgi:pSer/pThr/pTyr-binding forkhead associated (FHA) protein